MAHDVRWNLAAPVVAIGLAAAGCVGSTQAQVAAPATSAELEAQIETDLASLRSLEAFEVGRLVMHLPEQATACYGLPCNDQDRALWDSERQAQGERLHDLVARALPAASHVAGTAPDEATVSAALESLRSLEIVEVGALVQTTPANSPECYNLPCPADRAAADAANARAEAVVVAIDVAARQGS